MKTVSVFYFEKYDIVSDQVVRSKRPATLDAIRRIDCYPIVDSEEELNAENLDELGFRRRDW
jgi:hypothetical protein